MNNTSTSKRIITLIMILLCCVFVILGCAMPSSSGGGGDDDDPPPTPPPPPTPTLSEMVDSTWDAYNAGDLVKARSLVFETDNLYDPNLNNLDKIYAPYWNVSAWIYAANGELFSALLHFSYAIDSDSTFMDAYVGEANVYLLRDQYAEAINSGVIAVGLDAGYSPGHDGLSITQVRLILAQAYLYNGDITNSLLYVNQIDPSYSPGDAGYDPDPNTDLFMKIQALIP